MMFSKQAYVSIVVVVRGFVIGPEFFIYLSISMENN